MASSTTHPLPLMLATHTDLILTSNDYLLTSFTTQISLLLPSHPALPHSPHKQQLLSGPRTPALYLTRSSCVLA